MTAIQDTISVIFPREDKINFSITRYIWHLKLRQNHIGFPIIGAVFFEILVIIDQKSEKIGIFE